MPRYVLFGLLLTLILISAVAGSYLIPEPAVTLVPARPALKPDESVIAGPPRVKLAVLVVFDQMCADYLVKWRRYFPPGGFQRIMDEGCWFSECYYPYATTTTGPGHASMMTGTTQNFTGVINNEWYDRTAGRQVYCATTDRFENVSSGTVPAMSRTYRQHTTKKRTGGGSPERLISPSLADNLKAANRGGKVIGLSLKDRSAIFPCGHFADAAYWFSSEFVTSTYYMDSLPLWVRQFNDSKIVHSWFGRRWDRLRPDLDYNAIVGPDAGEEEANRAGLGITFPHPITGGEKEPKGKYYEALITSPFGNDLLLEFTKNCIEAEQLGLRGETDLLTISFSSNDLIGHVYGPDSHEVFDVTLRSDRTMADLLEYLDGQVGKGQYVVAVTSDHGICPLPAASRRRGIEADFVDADKLAAGANKFLETKYGEPVGDTAVVSEKDNNNGEFNRWIEATSMPWLYLNYRQLEARKLNRETVAEALAGWLRLQPNVYRVYTAKQLTDAPISDQVDRLVQASYHPERSGDLCILLKPYHYFGSRRDGGTTHGSPFEYDRHVPLLLYGPYLPRGQQTEPVAPLHAAAILADFLGLKPPRDCLFSLPKAMGR